MIKKKFISVIFLLLTFYLYSGEQDNEPVSVFYSGVKWAIAPAASDTPVAQGEEQKTELPEITVSALSVLSILSKEQNEIISSSINKNFIDMFTVSGVFKISDYSASQDADVEKLKKMHSYSIFPRITEFNIKETETSGLFLKISIIFSVENYLDGKNKDLSVSAIGWGSDMKALLADTLNNVTSQMEYVITGFEEFADHFRIKDIYQGSVVINKGKKSGIKRGDFFYSYNYHTGKKTGTFVVERAEPNLAYARVLDTKVKPTVEDPLKPYNYLGIISETYLDYFTGDFFSGYSAGTMLLWTRWLYTVNPVAGVNRYELVHIDGSKVVLINPYLGFRIVRYIKSFTLSSVVTFGRGYVLESEMDAMALGWGYFGGTVKIEVGKRIMKHLFLHVEGGYTGFLSSDYDNYPDITGFIFGGGLGFKF